MKKSDCKQILSLTLFTAVFSMAVDDTSDQFDVVYTADSVSVDQDSLVDESVSDAQNIQDERSVPVDQNVSKPTKSSIASVDFAPVPAESKKDHGAIVDVDFGKKGDAQYTAVKTGDDSYKAEKKHIPNEIFIAIGCIVVSLVFIALLI